MEKPRYRAVKGLPRAAKVESGGTRTQPGQAGSALGSELKGYAEISETGKVKVDASSQIFLASLRIRASRL